MHDYKSRCIYHITINKTTRQAALSQITGSPQNPIVNRSSLGNIIEHELRNFHLFHPHLQVIQYVIMPDHIHFAIFAKVVLPKALGSYIGMFKVKCGQIARDSLSLTPPIFEDDFYDRILRPAHSLDTICEYIRQNPYRLLMRQHYPDFFRRINNISINGMSWQAYGNIQLLDNPFKAPVVIHRTDSEQLKSAKHRRWQHLAENGGVLISPFISPAEKEVRKMCEKVNGKIILITNHPFGDRQKPGARDFSQCAQGRLLILAPMTALPEGRKTFLYLNSIAEYISAQKHT